MFPLKFTYAPQCFCLCHHKWSSSWRTPGWCIHNPPPLWPRTSPGLDQLEVGFLVGHSGPKVSIIGYWISKLELQVWCHCSTHGLHVYICAILSIDAVFYIVCRAPIQKLLLSHYQIYISPQGPCAQEPPTVSTKTIGPSVFNFKKVTESINLSSNDCTTCNCNSSTYLYRPCGHRWPQHHNQ